MTTEGEIHGGLLINLTDVYQMEPITFPFDTADTKRGNHVREYDPTIVRKFNYWHSSSNAAKSEIFVTERNVAIDGRMVGQNAEQVLRRSLNHVATMNAGLRREERSNMLEQTLNSVMPTLTTPAFISMEMASSQPKFLMFSREIPIYMNVFCDDACMLLMWSNEKHIEQRMREHYGNRFVVYRMPPIVNRVCVIHSYFLKKKINMWRYAARGNDLRVLNTLESFIFRRSKADENE